MIVVDLGCHGHGMYDSPGELIAKYHPAILYGFDPHPDTAVGVSDRSGTKIITHRAAAWTRSGEVGFALDGSGSHIASRGKRVRCFDLCRWLGRLPEREPLILKMDVEGAEYTLLPALRSTRMDERLLLVLVEWHGTRRVHLNCPVEEWWM